MGVSCPCWEGCFVAVILGDAVVDPTCILGVTLIDPLSDQSKSGNSKSSSKSTSAAILTRLLFILAVILDKFKADTGSGEMDALRDILGECAVLLASDISGEAHAGGESHMELSVTSSGDEVVLLLLVNASAAVANNVSDARRT